MMWRSMRYHQNRILPLVLIFMVCGLNFLPHQMAQAASPVFQPDPTKVSTKIVQAFQSQTTVRVIVSLVDPAAVNALSSVRAARVQQARNSVLATVATSDFRPYRQYSHVPALAGLADSQAIAALQSNPQVAFIQIDEQVSAHLGQSVPALGADVVHTYGITGQGVRVAVLDTGIDVTHPDLSDSIVAQHCFNAGGDCLPNRTTESNSAQDENGHGSNVSGIITSNGTAGLASVGFAPDAEIVAVRVLAANGSGWVSDWIAGLDWIIANQSTLQVQIINMSLGTTALYSDNCDAQQPGSASAIAQLHNLGITIFASSGNQGSSTAISSPACNGNVIAVGATYDGNVGSQPSSGTYLSRFGSPWPNCADSTTSLHVITCFTNSSSALDILAPGAPITSDYIYGGTSTFWGTSQASPTAAGVAALLLQLSPNLTPDQIESTLKTTGTLITDSRNSLQFPFINALSAVQSFTPATPVLINPSTPDTTDSRPIFSWSSIPLATKYEMRFGQDNPPLTTVVSANVTSYRPPTPLIIGTYYWQVRAVNSAGASNWTDPRSLIINSPADAAPPRNYYTVDTPTFSWNRISFATFYNVQVANNSAFSGAVTHNAGNMLSFTWPDSLPDGYYYWRVQACTTSVSCGAWSKPDSFEVDVP